VRKQPQSRPPISESDSSCYFSLSDFSGFTASGHLPSLV
jgi:hypothetical protein